MDSGKPLARVFEYGRRCVAVDVETTGLSASRGGRIIEVGAVAVEGRRMADEFHSLVNIRTRIPLPAQMIHGITNEMLVGTPKPEEVFPRFRAFIGDGVLVAHNARFDISFLRHEFSRLGMGLINQYHCTLELSRRRFPKLRDHKLETVYRHLFRGQTGSQEHRALTDARMVARVWLEMMKRGV